MRAIGLSALAVLCFAASPASAHTSQQAFVLLLPTTVYTAAGIAAVVLTVLALALTPSGTAARLFATKKLRKQSPGRLETFTSLASMMLLLFLLYCGFTGSRDPLENPLPLSIWTLWWIGLLSLQALAGDVWRWINPWTGFYRLLRGSEDAPGALVLPEGLAGWPAVFMLLAFAVFMLADPAPDDPSRLALIASAYWAVTLVGMLVFGARPWLTRCECFTILFRHYAKVSAFGAERGHVHVGLPGWQLTHTAALPLSGAVFVLLILGVGSFDGLNETFWWLGVIDVNPLEFPGRSAIVFETVAGTMVANLVLLLAFAASVYAGLMLIGETSRFAEVAGLLVVSILPIAVGYHIAHYLTAFLVNAQYALAAANDPLSNGADFLGLSGFHVTTGFFNTLGTVRMIWLAQAAAVVLGHILSILVAHAIAVEVFKDARRATISQLPLALFMIAYTFFGLWLLASPRGV